MLGPGPEKNLPSGVFKRADCSNQWVPFKPRLKGYDLVVIFVYFRDSIGCTGENLELM